MAKTQDIREIIKSEMGRRDLTAYKMWKLVEKHVSKTTVYNFLNGDAELTTSTLEHFLRALEIDLSPRR